MVNMVLLQNIMVLLQNIMMLLPDMKQLQKVMPKKLLLLQHMIVPNMAINTKLLQKNLHTKRLIINFID
jgi:hypothetical protein